MQPLHRVIILCVSGCYVLNIILSSQIRPCQCRVIILWYRFRFPSVLLVYYLLAPIILDVLYVILTAGSSSLLCYSSNLLENINYTTPFCSLLGKCHVLMITSYIATCKKSLTHRLEVSSM